MKRIWMTLGVVLFGAGCIKDETGSVETTVYGRFKADVAYNTAQGNAAGGNYMQWVEETGDNQLAITSRETRLGIKFKQGDNLNGLAEIDFYGAGTENKPGVLLRKLFAKMKVAENVSVLVGQTGDVFSPLLPAVLNYGWGWNCGNSGYRRPQVRVEYSMGDLVCQAALARALNDDDAGKVDTQARVGYKSDKVTGGLSIVCGPKAEADEVFGWALDLHVAIEKLVIRGEFFNGWNLKNYLAGISQVGASGEQLHTVGMWLQGGYKLSDELAINGGYMFDDPTRSQLDTSGDPARDKNSCLFVNGRYKLNKQAELGLELSWWTTTYWDGVVTESLKNTRIQTSLIYTF